MSTAKGKYFKAALLLLIFSLNTVVSFACSFTGLFHSLHHASEHKTEITPHQHKDVSAHRHLDGHQEHEEGGTPLNSEKDCCSKLVVELDKVEKAISKPISAPSLSFINGLFASISDRVPVAPLTSNHIRQEWRWRLNATIPDLRIVIQSFQI